VRQRRTQLLDEQRRVRLWGETLVDREDWAIIQTRGITGRVRHRREHVRATIDVEGMEGLASVECGVGKLHQLRRL
jgi:hypothetical protein